MEAKRSRALLIVPAFNEEATLRLVLQELRDGAPQFDIVVVNDGSSDSTPEIATLARRARARPLLQRRHRRRRPDRLQVRARQGLRDGRAGGQRRPVPAGANRLAGGAGAGRGLRHGDRLALPGGAGLRRKPAAPARQLHPFDHRDAVQPAEDNGRDLRLSRLQPPRAALPRRLLSARLPGAGIDRLPVAAGAEDSRGAGGDEGAPGRRVVHRRACGRCPTWAR